MPPSVLRLYLAALGVSMSTSLLVEGARWQRAHGTIQSIIRLSIGNSGKRADFDAMSTAFRSNGCSRSRIVFQTTWEWRRDNRLLDVSKWGPESAYAGWFDIDGGPPVLLAPNC